MLKLPHITMYLVPFMMFQGSKLMEKNIMFSRMFFLLTISVFSMSDFYNCKTVTLSYTCL